MNTGGPSEKSGGPSAYPSHTLTRTDVAIRRADPDEHGPLGEITAQAHRPDGLLDGHQHLRGTMHSALRS